MTLSASRAYDHVYDPHYVTSHHKDHNRATSKAMCGPNRMVRVPDDTYMFSELPHYPRHTIRLAPRDEVPTHVEKRWIAPQYKLTPGNDANKVTGAHRYKFFTRPQSLNATHLVHTREGMRGEAPTRAEPPTKTVGTQSMYRDSQTQSDPYSPEYIVTGDTMPEVLTLTHLSFGNGLPATEAELKMIERTRQKRLFEAMLPPPTDEVNLELRAKLMEEQEFRDWADREKTIKDLQERRLELLRTALDQRDDKRATVHSDKVERLRAKLEEERDRALATLQRRRVKVLRKMQQQQGAGQTKTKRDVIEEYADFTSEVYAPKARNGHVPDSNTARIEVQPADLTTYPGLLQLEQSLPPSVLKPLDRHPKEITQKKSSYTVRKEMEMASALKAAMAGIKKDLQPESDGLGTQPALGGMRQRDLRNLLERPETPSVEDVQPEDEEQQAAILLLQRLIRGRAYQNQMFEGKEKRLDLINELRAAERCSETATTVEEQRYIEQLREKAFDGVLESVQGTVISQTLDQLSKELLRFQEERRIAAMVKLAERDRQLRQAQESGRRQAEERLRAREDDMFRQIMGVHQGTVDSYLEDVLTNTVAQAAQSRALTEARLKAAHINRVVDEIESAAQDPEMIVRELVNSFNLPHVQREIVKRRIAVENKRFSEAARGAMDETYRRVEESLGSAK